VRPRLRRLRPRLACPVCDVRPYRARPTARTPTSSCRPSSPGAASTSFRPRSRRSRAS
jgi:hypothetical protein